MSLKERLLKARLLLSMKTKATGGEKNNDDEDDDDDDDDDGNEEDNAEVLASLL